MTYKQIDQTRMTCDEFHEIAPNPEQRDTVKHLAKASGSNGYMEPNDPIHTDVAVAYCKADKTYYRINGHTRDRAWTERVIPKPKMKLFVTNWLCDTLEDVTAVYERYDSLKSAKTADDTYHGILFHLGFEAESPLMKSHKLTSFFKYLNMHENNVNTIRRNCKLVVKHLHIVDAAKLKPYPNMTAPSFVALMLTVIAYGEDCMPFWQDFNGKRGRQMNGKMCSVAHLNEKYKDIKLDGCTGPAFVNSFVPFALEACDRYMRNVRPTQNISRYKDHRVESFINLRVFKRLGVHRVFKTKKEK